MENSNYILYLEDDPLELIKFKMALNDLGHTIPLISFENGQLGCDYLVTHINALPKVIVLDLRMPVMSGLEFLERIKEHLSLKRIPIIVLSSSENEDDILFSFDHQVAGYFVKPFDLDTYNEIISKIAAYWQSSKTPG
jgi:CheY-like chemotaxis protein